jgi:hypothetical protein
MLLDSRVTIAPVAQRAALLTTERQNVAVRIAHFELPVAIGLVRERRVDKCFAS